MHPVRMMSMRAESARLTFMVIYYHVSFVMVPNKLTIGLTLDDGRLVKLANVFALILTISDYKL